MILNSRFHFAALSILIVVILGQYLKESFFHHEAAAKIITIESRGLQFQEEYNAPQPPLTLRGGEGELLFHGSHVYHSPQLNIVIIDGGNIVTATTTAETVGDLILERRIPLAATDRVTPGLDRYLGDGERVRIDRIVDIEETRTAEIPFRTELTYDNGLYYGREEVVAAGAEGGKEQKFIVTYRNGVEIRRKLISQKTIQKPQTEIRKFGTLIEVVEETQGRASWYDYKKCMCAAAPYYEIGRYVRVTSLASGKSIIVRINDHGPDTSAYPERVLDLDVVSYRELASPSTGTIAVKVELLKN